MTSVYAVDSERAGCITYQGRVRRARTTDADGATHTVVLSMLMRRKYLVQRDCAEARSGVGCPRCTTYQPERLQGRGVKDIMLADLNAPSAYQPSQRRPEPRRGGESTRFAVTQRRLLPVGSRTRMARDGRSYLSCTGVSLMVWLEDLADHAHRRPSTLSSAHTRPRNREKAHSENMRAHNGEPCPE